MFETAELGQKVPKKEYRERVIELREGLLMAQQRVRSAPFPVVIGFAGVDGAGKGETVNLLNEWMDPRWLVTRAMGAPTEEERERPRYWRYWRDQPPKGHIGLFLSAWYTEPLVSRAYGKIDAATFDEELDDIIAFEKTLADDGAIIMKFWMHLGNEAQKKRLRKLEKDKLESWRVTEKDWKHWRMYDQFVAAAERIIMRTSTGQAPWHIVEGSDANYRSLRVGEVILAELTRRLDEHEQTQRVLAELGSSPTQPLKSPGPAAAEETVEPTPPKTVLSRLDMSLSLGKDEYRRALREQHARLNLLHRKARAERMSIVMVFEGWDAAGKGGAIRRLTSALDARSVRVIPVAAPTDEERAQHYLWRFWRHLGRVGRVTIFDRTWYGRVLVERVEGFASEDEWRRAYAEINHFEQQLVDHGIVLCKFWVHITKEEQARRFEERSQIAYKRWKLTDEDWRNRERWDDYEIAVHDMVERTSTQIAPWSLIPANDKRYGRIEVLKTVSNNLERALEKRSGK